MPVSLRATVPMPHLHGTSPFEKGGLRGICAGKIPPTPLFQRGARMLLAHVSSIIYGARRLSNWLMKKVSNASSRVQAWHRESDLLEFGDERRRLFGVHL